MTRFLAILAALTCAASAQTYRTVTADTNNAIRTNFTLGAAQVSGAFAISNVTGLQSALDGKLATNGDASALTNFPALLLTTNSSASAFPSALLRTNGDGSGLTNLPNADLGSATGILPIANGGTGGTNASEARTALELGTAATNDATAFQPANTNLTALAGGDGSNLTNVTITDASTLTNFPAELLRTNGDAAGLTNFPANLLRTNGDGSGLSNVSVDLTAVLPAYSNNAAKVLAVASGETNVEWIAVSNTVTDASTLTNFPASILQTNSADASFPAFLLRTNGSAAGLTSFPASLLTTNGDASGLTNFPVLNQNTTGTASNVTGVVAIANGGSGQTTAAAAIEAFLPSYAGNADRILALNSNANGLVWTTNAGGGGGIVNLADTTNGVTNTLGIANGGSGATNATDALKNFMGTTNSTVFILASSNSGDGSVVIGQNSSSVGNASVAIGNSATVLYSGSPVFHATSVALGNNAVSGGSGAYRGVAIGTDVNATNYEAIAIGSYAEAKASSAIQIGRGANSNASTVQFVTWGSVDSNKWGALANAGTVGTNLLRSTNAAAAIEALLPAYSGNADRILALNSNATGLVWTTNAGGGGGLTSPVAIVDGGTGATNTETALQNLSIVVSARTNSVAIRGTNSSANSIAIGSTTTATAAGFAVAIGSGASSSGNSVAIGQIAGSGDYGVAVGSDAKTGGLYSIAIGYQTRATNNQTVAIGNGAAITGSATNSVQIGAGSINTSHRVQINNWGLVDSNKWGALANAGAVGTNLLRSTNITGAQAAIFTNTTTNAPTNTNAPTPDAWLDIRVGTNDYKLPLWQ